VEAGQRLGAALIVALTDTDAQKEAVSAALARKSTGAISKKYESEMQGLWEEANKPTLNFIRLVLVNNPLKTVDEILERADVQQALTEPYVEVADKSEALIVRGWDEAEEDAVSKVKGELALLKAQWQDFRRNRTVQRRVVADVRRNALAMKPRLIAAMRAQHRSEEEPAKEPLQKVADDSVLRARYSVQTAIWSVVRAVRDSAFQKAGLNKKWKARFGPNMCSHCRKLHGVVVGPFEEFPKKFSGLHLLAVYGGKLYGPPRHPNCECIPVATREPRTSVEDLEALGAVA
jgi:hypothetical protein